MSNSHVWSTKITNEQHTARELSAWSKLAHPNVAECLGLAVFKDQLVMISAWMAQGNVLEFLKRRPETDRHSMVG